MVVIVRRIFIAPGSRVARQRGHVAALQPEQDRMTVGPWRMPALPELTQQAIRRVLRLWGKPRPSSGFSTGCDGRIENQPRALAQSGGTGQRMPHGCLDDGLHNRSTHSVFQRVVLEDNPVGHQAGLVVVIHTQPPVQDQAQHFGAPDLIARGSVCLQITHLGQSQQHLHQLPGQAGQGVTGQTRIGAVTIFQAIQDLLEPRLHVCFGEQWQQRIQETLALDQTMELLLARADGVATPLFFTGTPCRGSQAQRAHGQPGGTHQSGNAGLLHALTMPMQSSHQFVHFRAQVLEDGVHVILIGKACGVGTNALEQQRQGRLGRVVDLGGKQPVIQADQRNLGGMHPFQACGELVDALLHRADLLLGLQHGPACLSVQALSHGVLPGRRIVKRLPAPHQIAQIQSKRWRVTPRHGVFKAGQWLVLRRG